MQPANFRIVARHAEGSVEPRPYEDHAAGSHVVQFYENDHFLSAAVADFLAAGLINGQPLVIIATPDHRDAFTVRLRAKGCDIDGAVATGQATFLDASSTLASFMIDGKPDAVRFRAAIEPVLVRAAAAHGGGVIRAYGEMVDLLWEQGNTDGAIRLEELWNELAAIRAFTLLCAYAMGHFYKNAGADQYHRVCGQHSHVVPVQQYGETHEAGQAIEITALQQRTHALEAEISHRAELEQRLREALSARGAAEAALTRALECEQAARAEAEAANRAKSEFLAVMSHELRTPLNAIGGHVQLIQLGLRGAVTDAQHDALQRVQRNQQHLLALINDVLNLARIETGRVEFKMESVALGPLLSDVLSTVEPLLTTKQLTYAVSMLQDGPGDELAAKADAEKLQQIMLNLLTNATKFTPSGGTVAIEARESDERADIVRVSVRDTGIGIPASKLETIFEPFVQLGQRMTCPHEGVGLGLAISRDLARGMGGELAVQSDEGVGSTFVLTLPRA
jgi:signal transduction histidine kinase